MPLKTNPVMHHNIYKGKLRSGNSAHLRLSSGLCLEELKYFVQSLMIILKRNGPKNEPCGVPQYIQRNTQIWKLYPSEETPGRTELF